MVNINATFLGASPLWPLGVRTFAGSGRHLHVESGRRLRDLKPCAEGRKLETIFARAVCTVANSVACCRAIV